jgi:hypothetical protein
MMSVLIPSLLGFGVVLGLVWAGCYLLLPSRVTMILALVVVVLWLLFACNLLLAFLE